MRKPLFFILCVIFFSSCAVFQASKWNSLYGSPSPSNRDIAPVENAEVEYWSDVKPILDNRCVVCHACYDAPCQLKLTAPEGIERGAIAKNPYDTRVTPENPRRLFIDRFSAQQWREFGFHPVLNEHVQNITTNRVASPFYRLLEQKQKVPTPSNNQKLSNEFTLGLHRKQACVKPREVDEHIAKHPSWGMPYALPALASNEQNTLKAWVEQGAKYKPSSISDDRFLGDIQKWEMFFNGDSLKTQLMSRYIYEHLFLANIYFKQNDNAKFFKMVRSSTPPGSPVAPIYTRRPYDDPKIKRVYYRLIAQRETIVSKTHMPYLLDERRIQKWQKIFLNKDYTVAGLPGYEKKIASNPFKSFKDIPANSRYKFLLDEAQFTIMNFIKGPVCRGQVALNVIRDHFWIFFTDPDALENTAVSEFLIENFDEFELPAATESSYTLLNDWRRYSDKERKILESKQKFLESNISARGKIDLNLIWDGDGHNQNAALTVFRHYDNATVEKGLVGDSPKTAWVISYSLLERIHYLLVAGYDVYGNAGHQLLTRLYMDFLRIEGEANFMLLLPTPTRQNLRANWYEGAPKSCHDFIENTSFEKNREPDIVYMSNNHQDELYGMMKTKLRNVLDTRRDIDGNHEVINQQLKRLSKHAGRPTIFLPETVYIRVDSAKNDKQYFTLLRNNDHSNITSMFKEEKQLTPDTNTLTVAKGLLGSYPNALFVVTESNLESFVDAIINLKSGQDFSNIMARYGIRRTHPQFWRYSDQLHEALLLENRVEYGVLDYNRLGNF